MEHFLINSSVCLFTLWLVYKLLLENTSWHVFKRWYLLGSFVVSFTIPFIVIKTVVLPVQEMPVLEFQNSMAPHQATDVVTETGFVIDWVYVVLGFYLVGVCIMLWRFLKNIVNFKIQKTDVISSYAGYKLILREEVSVPHSFMNRIFVSKKRYEQDLVPTVVLEHEKTHLDQRHSLDLLFVELLLVVFWFNPVMYMLRYAIKLNHEFLADQAVLKTGIPTKEYQELILNHATSQYTHAVANTFTFPNIKKRFTIMKTQTSTTAGLLRSLIIIPVFALLVLSCGKKVTEFKNTPETKENATTIYPFGDSGYVQVGDEMQYFKKDSTGVKFYDKAGEAIDPTKKGFKIKTKSTDIFENSGPNPNTDAIKEYKIFLDSVPILQSEINKISPDAIKSIQVVNVNGRKHAYINTKETARAEPTTKKIQMQTSPFGNMVKSNDSVTFNFVSISPTRQEGLKTEKAMTTDEKKQLNYRKTIMRAASQTKQQTLYTIKEKPAGVDEIFEFIHQYPHAHVKLIEQKDGKLVLAYSKPKRKKMQDDELQTIYTTVYNNMETNTPNFMMMPAAK